VYKDVYAISNHYTIGSDAGRVSPGLATVVRRFGWSGQGAPNYAEVIADSTKAHIGSACERRARATSLLTSAKGDLSVANMVKVLRDHDPTGQDEGNWSPSGALKYSLCIHAGVEARNTQTTGSMASELRQRNAVHWVTGTSCALHFHLQAGNDGCPAPSTRSAPHGSL